MSWIRELATRALSSLWYGRNPLCWLLWPVAVVYRLLVEIRRFAYRQGWLRSTDVGVPVIVVGNLTVGGTGKTPLVIWLAQRLRDRGFRVGIVCRGYGGNSGKWPQPVAPFTDVARVGDEARLLALKAGCPVVAGPDRVAAARMLLRPGPLDLILADDGLQHYALGRAIEIAVVDGTRGLGNGLCLPAGPLREAPSRLREVDAVVVNGGEYGHAGVLRASLRPIRVVEMVSGAARSLDDFANQSVHAVAAIGNPARFFDLLAEHGLEVEPHPLADHAVPTVEDLEFDDDLPVLITEKDAVKCEALGLPGLWRVETELEFRAGDDERLLRVITRLLEQQAVKH